MQRNKSYMLVDLSIILHACYWVCKRWSEEPNVDDLYKQIVLSLNSLVNTGTYSAAILCCDYGHSWRRAHLKSYKESRTHTDSKLELMHAVTDKLEEDYFMLKAESLEADDMIAIAIHLLEDKHNLTIVSGDADMKQLVQNENVRYLNYRTKEYTTLKDEGHYYMFEIFDKILDGCKTDEIPQLTKKGTRRKKKDEFIELCIHRFNYETYATHKTYADCLGWAVHDTYIANPNIVELDTTQIARNVILGVLDVEILEQELGETYADALAKAIIELKHIL